MYSILVVYDITENEKSVKLYITLYTLFTVFIGIRRTASVYGYGSRGGRKNGVNPVSDLHARRTRFYCTPWPVRCTLRDHLVDLGLASPMLNGTIQLICDLSLLDNSESALP